MLKAKKKLLGSLLGVGEHIVKITEISRDQSHENDNWKDLTDQLKFVAKNDEGSITAWMNIDAFQNASDYNGVAPKGTEFRSFDDDSEKFVVNKKTGKRVKSEERMEKLQEQFTNLAYALGIDEDKEFEDLDELLEEIIDVAVGAEIGIRVKENARGYNEVTYTMLPEEVKVSSEVED